MYKVFAYFMRIPVFETYNHIFYKSASICLVTYSTLMYINLIGQCFHLICLVESLVPPLHNAASEAEYHPIPGISTSQCPKDQWFSFLLLPNFENSTSFYAQREDQYPCGNHLCQLMKS